MFVTNVKVRLRDVIPGGIAAGLMLEMITLIFPLYIANSPSFTGFGVVFGVLMVLLSFFFFLGLITVLGACVNAEVAERRRSRAGGLG